MVPARIAQLMVRQPTSSASLVARSSFRLVMVTAAPRAIRPKAIDRATPPAPRISDLLVEERAGVRVLRTSAEGVFQRVHRRAVVGVVADPLAVLDRPPCCTTRSARPPRPSAGAAG